MPRVEIIGFIFVKISQKSVDFVLSDKNSCKPILAIELDDSSQKGEERKIRDEFCNRVFASAGLPVLHVAYRNGYSTSRLKEEIQNMLMPKEKTQISEAANVA